MMYVFVPEIFSKEPTLTYKAHALVGEGLMDALVDLERLGEYWHHMLSDFPAHPAASDPGHALPISLYGFLAMKSIS